MTPLNIFTLRKDRHNIAEWEQDMETHACNSNGKQAKIGDFCVLKEREERLWDPLLWG